MKERLIKNERLSEEYYEIDHDSGLKIFIMEKPRYNGAFACFGTKYGSIDTCFRLKGEKDYTTVPEGIAHFLEHKLFESEELDAFERFSKTGANANAYTSFDRTCYIFQCAGEFKKNLEILLDFVKKPYFTEKTVQKEQGIIGQEIRMYQDSPDWQVLFNLLRGIYKNNPVRIDIAGTIDSISKINADLLYSCYNTFYNLSNMALAVAGNVKKEDVLEIVDKIVQKEDPVYFEQIIPEEPKELCEKYIEEELKVDIPKFAIGFKENITKPLVSIKEALIMNLALEIIAGRVSPFYASMIEKGLINTSFSKEYFFGRGFACPLFSGESTNPKKVKEELLKAIKEIQQNGIPDEDFEISRKKLYGSEIYSYNEVEELSTALMDAYLGGYNIFDKTELYSSITKEDVQKIIGEAFDEELCCLSVIK